MGRYLLGTGHHATATQRRPRPHLERPLRDRPAAPGRRVRAMRITGTGRGAPHPGTQRPQPQEEGQPARMGQADGSTPPQDPRRLPRMPRGHPHRKPSTATTMSTGEPRCSENEQVRFGGRPSEKDQFMAPRWRPTLRHVRFGERPGETDREQSRHRAPARLNHITFAELLDHAVPHVAADTIDISAGPGAQPLHPLWAVAGLCTRSPTPASMWRRRLTAV